VRLQEANAGEIGISETIRAIFAARAKGVITMGVICGKNGAYGGMGIISTCLDYLLVDEIGRTGVSGAEVIQTVKGVEAFDAADRPLIWRVYGGKTRFLQHIADCFVDGSIQSIRQALIHRLELGAPVETLLEQARCQQRLLQRRVDSTQGCQDEGEYLTHLASPYAAASLRGSSPLKGDQ
jgi:malonate decarboxylase beta subunit